MNVLFWVLLVVQPSVPEKLLARVYFDFNSSVLKPDAKAILKTVADRMKDEPTLLIDVNGYTDSVGTIPYNLALSEDRALAVKRYLVDHLKISDKRIYVKGYGTCDPIASEDSEEGRRQNRRADIVVHEPEALLTRFRNQVMVQPPPLIPEWVKPTPNYYLYRLYKVNTGKHSSADIQFPGKGVLRMDEEALLTIYGLQPTFPERLRIRNIELQSGGLMSMLEGLSAKESVIANTPAAVVKLYSKESKVTVDKELNTLVSVYDGYAEVSGAGKKVIVNKGEGTIVKKEAPPEKPRPLPLAPSRLHFHSKYEKVFPGVSCLITFAWESTAPNSHFQLSRDSMFHDQVVDTFISSNSISYQLKEGSYYWRVSCIDDKGLEGKFSTTIPFTIECDSIKPPLGVSIVDDEKRRDAYALDGKTESTATVYINQQKIQLTDDGRFYYHIPREEDSLHVQAFDEVGNLSEYTCPVPSPPSLEWGVIGGMWRTVRETGYFYGVEIAYILWFNTSIYFDAATGGPTRETGNVSFNKLMPIGVGIRQEFGSRDIAPFFNLGAGVIRRDKELNFSIGIDGGCKLYLGAGRVIKLYINYSHLFGATRLISYKASFQFRT